MGSLTAKQDCLMGLAAILAIRPLLVTRVSFPVRSALLRSRALMSLPVKGKQEQAVGHSFSFKRGIRKQSHQSDRREPVHPESSTISGKPSDPRPDPGPSNTEKNVQDLMSAASRELPQFITSLRPTLLLSFITVLGCSSLI